MRYKNGNLYLIVNSTENDKQGTLSIRKEDINYSKYLDFSYKRVKNCFQKGSIVLYTLNPPQIAIPILARYYTNALGLDIDNSSIIIEDKQMFKKTFGITHFSNNDFARF